MKQHPEQISIKLAKSESSQAALHSTFLQLELDPDIAQVRILEGGAGTCFSFKQQQG